VRGYPGNPVLPPDGRRRIEAPPSPARRVVPARGSWEHDLNCNRGATGRAGRGRQTAPLGRPWLAAPSRAQAGQRYGGVIGARSPVLKRSSNFLGKLRRLAKHPEGMPAISPGSRRATRGSRFCEVNDPGGVAARALRPLRGRRGSSYLATGGGADHAAHGARCPRLIAWNPPGSPASHGCQPQHGVARGSRRPRQAKGPLARPRGKG